MKIEKPAADFVTVILLSLIMEYIKQGNTITDSLLAFLKWSHKELYGYAEVQEEDHPTNEL